MTPAPAQGYRIAMVREKYIKSLNLNLHVCIYKVQHYNNNNNNIHNKLTAHTVAFILQRKHSLTLIIIVKNAKFLHSTVNTENNSFYLPLKIQLVFCNR